MGACGLPLGVPARSTRPKGAISATAESVPDQTPRAYVSRDIADILEGWDYDPDRVSVRIILGSDGKEKIQLRLDLGLLQLELHGRPDGQRPLNHESWLEYYIERQTTHDRAHPDGPAFTLDDHDCGRLLREGIQYYHRYLSFWHLERYELCARDTNRNLKLFKFVREFATTDQQKLRFDQWRPYVTMMHARSVAQPFVELRDYETALRAIDAGIRAIREFLTEYRQLHRAEECSELTELEQLREEIAKKLDEGSPYLRSTVVDKLRQQLDEAVVNEKFEEAARLRDEIERLGAEDGGSEEQGSG